MNFSVHHSNFLLNKSSAIIAFSFFPLPFICSLRVLRSQKTPSEYPCMLFSLPIVSKRFSARQQYCSSISMPTYLRPSFLATTEVVPEPRNGSKITSFGFELAKIALATNFSGFCVGWSVFSDIDQKGIVISVQTFEGKVILYFPSPFSSQSFALPSLSLYGAITFRLIFTASTLK